MAIIYGPNIRVRLQNEVIRRARDPIVQYLVPRSRDVARLPMAELAKHKSKAKAKSTRKK
jgi:hypothetical protein